MPYRNDDSDHLDPAEFPDPDADDDGAMPCPACGGLMADDAVRCPHCAEYITDERRRSPWVVAGLLLCLAMALGWAFAG